MKNQWRVWAGFLLIFLVVIFAILNNEPVPVNLLVAKIEAPLILVILGSAIIGALIISLVATGTLWHQNKTIKSLQKDLASQQTQSQQLPVSSELPTPEEVGESKGNATADQDETP